MGKYDSPRKSYPGRASQPQAGLSYVPMVRRAALDEHAIEADAAIEGSAATAWDDAFEELEGDDEALPVPDMGVEETKIVARQIVIPAPAEAPRESKLLDPMAMLEAATIRSTPKARQ